MVVSQKMVESPFNLYPNGDQAYNALAVYVCKEYSGELRKCEEESLELRFFSLDDLPELSYISGKVIDHYIKNHHAYNLVNLG